jgi:hypothetical protein
MRQVRDTLVWLAMILVVGGVIYVMPQVSTYVDAATGNEHGPACVTYGESGVSHHSDIDHQKHDR